MCYHVSLYYADNSTSFLGYGQIVLYNYIIGYPLKERAMTGSHIHYVGNNYSHVYKKKMFIPSSTMLGIKLNQCNVSFVCYVNVSTNGTRVAMQNRLYLFLLKPVAHIATFSFATFA